jgi:hypothetical protein
MHNRILIITGLIRLCSLFEAFRRQTGIGINKQNIMFRKIYVILEGGLSRMGLLLAFNIGQKKYSFYCV